MSIDRFTASGLVPFGGLVLLALFVPVLSYLSVRQKASKEAVRLNGAVDLYNLRDNIYYKIFLNQHVPITTQTWFLMIVLTAMNFYMSFLLIYTPIVLTPPSQLANFLLLGPLYGRQQDLESEIYILQTFDVICFSYLGWYVWTV